LKQASCLSKALAEVLLLLLPEQLFAELLYWQLQQQQQVELTQCSSSISRMGFLE
jgi:hypothetical protein